MVRVYHLLLFTLLVVTLVQAQRLGRGRKDRDDNNFLGRLIAIRRRDGDSLAPSDLLTSDTRRPRPRGRLRLNSFVQKVARGLDTGYRGYRSWQADRMSQINQAVKQTMDGLAFALTMLPYQEMQDTATRVGQYFTELTESGVPVESFNTLLTTRVGGPTQTIKALLETDGDPDLLAPILQDIGANYEDVYMVTAGEMEKFLEVLTGYKIPLPRSLGLDLETVDVTIRQPATDDSPDDGQDGTSTVDDGEEETPVVDDEDATTTE